MKTVDIVISTPSMLLPHDPSEYLKIKTVAVAGEACPEGTNTWLNIQDLLTDHSTALADSWAKRVQFYNCCGPTEVSLYNNRM